jgi:hypothetical protein
MPGPYLRRFFSAADNRLDLSDNAFYFVSLPFFQGIQNQALELNLPPLIMAEIPVIAQPDYEQILSRQDKGLLREFPPADKDIRRDFRTLIIRRSRETPPVESIFLDLPGNRLAGFFNPLPRNDLFFLQRPFLRYKKLNLANSLRVP